MDDMLVGVYVREVGTQATFAVESANLYKTALQAGQSPRVVFFHLHHFLIHCSNVVKLLFPKAGSSVRAQFATHRAEAVRQRLGITKPLDPPQVAVRNDFEHFDERIDAWVQSSRHHNFADMNIMPVSMIAGLDAGDFFRNLDPQTLSLSFCGRSYDLDSLESTMREVAQLASRAQRPRLG